MEDAAKKRREPDMDESGEEKEKKKKKEKKEKSEKKAKRDKEKENEKRPTEAQPETEHPAPNPSKTAKISPGDAYDPELADLDNDELPAPAQQHSNEAQPESGGRRVGSAVPPPPSYSRGASSQFTHPLQQKLHAHLQAQAQAQASTFRVEDLDKMPASNKRKLLWKGSAASASSSSSSASQTAGSSGSGSGSSSSNSVAAWEAAEFEDEHRKNKFLALMGAKKQRAAGAPVGSGQSYLPSSSEYQQMMQDLEQQFNQGRAARGQGRVGLGSS